MRSPTGSPVYILDADRTAGELLCGNLKVHGFDCVLSSSPREFWSSLDRRLPDALVASVDIDGILDVVERMSLANVLVIATQAKPDVSKTVLAMKAGATDVLLKPLQADDLGRTIKDWLQRPNGVTGLSVVPARLVDLPALTVRERQVLQHVINGASSKIIGRALGLSPRTVELHRAHIMQKLGARNAADLVRMVVAP